MGSTCPRTQVVISAVGSIPGHSRTLQFFCSKQLNFLPLLLAEGFVSVPLLPFRCSAGARSGSCPLLVTDFLCEQPLKSAQNKIPWGMWAVQPHSLFHTSPIDCGLCWPHWPGWWPKLSPGMQPGSSLLFPALSQCVGTMFSLQGSLPVLAVAPWIWGHIRLLLPEITS